MCCTERTHIRQKFYVPKSNLRWIRTVAFKETGYKRFNIHRTRKIIAKGTGRRDSIYSERSQKKKKKTGPKMCLTERTHNRQKYYVSTNQFTLNAPSSIQRDRLQMI